MFLISFLFLLFAFICTMLIYVVVGNIFSFNIYLNILEDFIKDHYIYQKKVNTNVMLI